MKGSVRYTWTQANVLIIWAKRGVGAIHRVPYLSRSDWESTTKQPAEVNFQNRVYELGGEITKEISVSSASAQPLCHVIVCDTFRDFRHFSLAQVYLMVIQSNCNIYSVTYFWHKSVFSHSLLKFSLFFFTHTFTCWAPSIGGYMTREGRARTSYTKNYDKCLQFRQLCALCIWK